MLQDCNGTVAESSRVSNINTASSRNRSLVNQSRDLATGKMEGDTDPVSTMQEAVDNLALSMFDALRLIPFTQDVKGGQRGTITPPVGASGAEPVSIRRAAVTDAAWVKQVQTLADGVVKQAKTLDGLIDVLPGAELREEEQMEEISRLDEEGRRKRAELAELVGQADELKAEINENLDQLAEHMLAAPR